jgi:hypothetical protein
MMYFSLLSHKNTNIAVYFLACFESFQKYNPLAENASLGV